MHRNSIHEPLVADGDHRIFISHRVFRRLLLRPSVLQNDRPPCIPVFLDDLIQLLEHHLQLSGFALEDLLQTLDDGLELLEPPLDLFLLESGQPGESHVENGVRLDLGQSEKVLKCC